MMFVSLGFLRQSVFGKKMCLIILDLSVWGW